MQHKELCAYCRSRTFERVLEHRRLLHLHHRIQRERILRIDQEKEELNRIEAEHGETPRIISAKKRVTSKHGGTCCMISQKGSRSSLKF